MTLLGFFIVIWLALIGANYFIGLAIEAMWGSGASLLSFLVLFFGSIFVAWQAAVRLSEPKRTDSASR